MLVHLIFFSNPFKQLLAGAVPGNTCLSVPLLGLLLLIIQGCCLLSSCLFTALLIFVFIPLFSKEAFMKQCLSSMHVSFINNSLINLDQREKEKVPKPTAKSDHSSGTMLCIFCTSGCIICECYLQYSCQRALELSSSRDQLKKPPKVLSCYMEICSLGNKMILSKNDIVFLEVVFDFCGDADISGAYPYLLGKAIRGSSRTKIHQWLNTMEASGNEVKIVSMTCRN